MKHITHCEQETFNLGTKLANKGTTFLLYGDLGAGKTALIRGICARLGVPPEQIHSPTFAIVNEYNVDALRSPTTSKSLPHAVGDAVSGVPRVEELTSTIPLPRRGGAACGDGVVVGEGLAPHAVGDAVSGVPRVEELTFAIPLPRRGGAACGDGVVVGEGLAPPANGTNSQPCVGDAVSGVPSSKPNIPLTPNPYPLTPIYHIDAYRLTPETWLSGGFDEYLDNGICLIEWAENIPPIPGVQIKIEGSGNSPRQIEITNYEL